MIWKQKERRIWGKDNVEPQNIQSIQSTLSVLAMKELLNPVIIIFWIKRRFINSQNRKTYYTQAFDSIAESLSTMYQVMEMEGRSRGARNQRPCSIMLEPDKVISMACWLFSWTDPPQFSYPVNWIRCMCLRQKVSWSSPSGNVAGFFATTVDPGDSWERNCCTHWLCLVFIPLISNFLV